MNAFALYIDELCSKLATGINGRGVNFRKQWRSILEECGVEYQPIYIMRHTFATQAVFAGVPANAMQQLLGHSTLDMTTRYTRIVEEATHAGAKALEGVFVTKS